MARKSEPHDCQPHQKHGERKESSQKEETLSGREYEKGTTKLHAIKVNGGNNFENLDFF